MAETTENRLTRLESDVEHIRSDVADIKVDLRELRNEIGDLRTETQKQFGGVLEKIGDLRTETQKQFNELREDMRDKFETVRRSNLETRIWMLLIGGAIFGVMAHALHWL